MILIYLMIGVLILFLLTFLWACLVISGDQAEAEESAGFRNSEGLPPCPQIGGSSPPSPIEEAIHEKHK